MLSGFDFPDKFSDFVHARGWTHKERFPITVIDFSDHFMVVPSNIDQEEYIRSFFDFQFRHEDEYRLYHAPLCDEKQTLYWEIPCQRDQPFEQLFPKHIQFSSAYLLANWTIREALDRNKPLLVAHLFGKSMHIFAADPEQLLFANSFPINDFQDTAYFLLRCMDQLQLSPAYTPCVFCSESENEEEIAAFFSPYIKKFRMAFFTHETEYPLQIIEE